MKLRLINGDLLFTFVVYFLITMAMIICVFPFLNIIAVSFSGTAAVSRNAVTIFPVDVTLNSYQFVLKNKNIWRSYGNSIMYTSLHVAASLLVTSLAAYPLSKKRLVGRKGLLFYVTFTTIFHGGMIPTYMVVRSMGLLNTTGAIIIPYCFTVYNCMLLRNAFEGLPSELEESAKIDGLSDFGIMYRIYVPLSKPIYATLTLMLAITAWNSYMPALLYLNGTARYPLQMILRDIVINDVLASYREMAQDVAALPAAQSLKSATIVVVMLPIMAVYPFLQRFFVKGLLVGSVKG